MENVREEISDRVKTFRKMTTLANQQEAAGDHQGAFSTRVALYEEVKDTERYIVAKIKEIESGTMEKEAINLGGLADNAAKYLDNVWGPIKKFGRGLWDAIAHGKVAPETAEAIQKRSPGLVRRKPGQVWEFPSTLDNVLSSGSVDDIGDKLTGAARRSRMQNTVKKIGPEYGVTPLGRGLAAGGVGAAGLGAGALALRGKDGEPRSEMADRQYPNLPREYPRSPRLRSSRSRSVGLSRGGPGTAVLPPSGSVGYNPRGGYGTMPTVNRGGGSGMGSPGIQQINNQLSSISEAVTSHETRIRNLENRT